jgi:hypothetical protein
MLIEIFTDYIRNKKNLRDYVEIRKHVNERGEFNDTKLIRIQENLERLKEEEPEIYNGMYEVLEEVFKYDAGLSSEYPLDFAREILKMYNTHQSPKDIYEEYKMVLKHRYQTRN